MVQPASLVPRYARRAPLATAALLLLVVAPCAHAQSDSARADSVRAEPRAATRDSARVRQLPRQRITGTRLGANDGPIAATGTRTDVATSLAVAPGPAALASALETLPGITSFDDQGTRAQPTLVVRGFTLSPVVGVPQGVSVFLDGVRVNEADAQQVHFDLLPADAVERVQLSRGPSALFGKNTLAGALLLTTKRGDPIPRLEAGTELGPWGYRGVRAEAGGVRGGWDGYASARLARDDGWRDETGSRRAVGYATVGHRALRHDVALSLLVARDSLGQAGSLPESWIAPRPRANYTGGDFSAPDAAQATLRGERRFGSGDAGPLLRGNAYLRRTRTEQFNVNVDEPSTRAFVRAVTGGATLEVEPPSIELGLHRLELVGGIEASRSGVRYRVFREATDEASIDPADCSPRAAGTVGLCEHARVVGDDAALYAQAVLHTIADVSVTVAARADLVRVPFEDLREPGNSETSVFRRVSPRVAAQWRHPLGLPVQAYASIGTGFRAPAALELACASEDDPCPLPFSLGDDPPLAPVRARTAEAGLDWARAWTHAGVRASASAYRTDVRDEIVLVQSERTAGFFRNLARTRRLGVELAGEAHARGGVHARASWTWLDATYRSAARLASALEDAAPVAPGDRIPLAPAHRATAWLGVTRPVRATVVGIEASLAAVSPQFLRGDEGNTQAPLAGYTVAGARAHVAWRHLTTTVDVTNLLDRHYASFGIWGENALAPDGSVLPDGERVERFLTPGLPRSITVTLSIAR